MFGCSNNNFILLNNIDSCDCLQCGHLWEYSGVIPYINFREPFIEMFVPKAPRTAIIPQVKLWTQIQQLHMEAWNVRASTSFEAMISRWCATLSNWATKPQIVYNYPPKGRWIVVDIYRDAKRRGIYLPLFTDPEGNSCFSIYQIRWIKKRFFNFVL